jgi:hypothetical protein
MSPHRIRQVTAMRRLGPLFSIATLIAASAEVHAASVCGRDLFNDDLPLRACGRESCDRILPMPEKTPVAVLKRHGDWSEVEVRNRHNILVRGWALSRFICHDP